MAVVLQTDALLSQQLRLLNPAGNQPARVIHNAMTRIPPVTVGAAEHRSHQACIPVSPDKPGNLTVANLLLLFTFEQYKNSFGNSPHK